MIDSIDEFAYYKSIWTSTFFFHLQINDSSTSLTVKMCFTGERRSSSATRLDFLLMDRIDFSWLTDEDRTKLRVVPVNLTKESPVVSPLLRRG